MTDLAHDLERKVNEARKLGDVRTLLEVANAAVDRLEAAAGVARGPFSEGQLTALNAARRISYNVAADVWPGWEIGLPARSDAELEAAQALARRSSALTEQLDQGAVKRGTASWLIGAFDLARDKRKEALAAFGVAAAFYADAPAVKLLAEGYMAIAAEFLDTSSASEAPEFAWIIAELDKLASEDAKEFRNQLQVARQVFNHR